MTYLNGCETAIHARLFMGPDGVHPTTTGGWHIATALANAIRGGSATTDFFNHEAVFTPYKGTATVYIRQSIVSNTVQTDFSIILNDINTEFVGAYETPIGDLVLPLSNAFPIQHVMLTVKYADGTYTQEPFDVRVRDDKLVLVYQGLNEDKTSFATIQVKDINCFHFYTVHNALID